MEISGYRGESDKEVIDAFYDIYKYNLQQELLTLEECQRDLEIAEEEEQSLACAGIFKAMNNYQAIKDEKFNELLMEIITKTE